MTTVATRPTVGYQDLREYLALLEQKGLLKRITAPVDLDHEVGAITARSLERKGPALYFVNCKGYQGKPLVSNIISTTAQLAVAFNTEPDEAALHERVVEGLGSRIPSVTVASGPCKEVIQTGDDVDITIFPTPIWHEHDGGRYIGTTTGFITRNPRNGELNMGSYRIMIKDKKTVTMAGGIRGWNSTTGSGGGDHILENEKNGKPTPIAIVMGMDPLLTLASGSPAAPGPDGSMEYEAAAGWRGAPTELVKCETNDLLVPARAEAIVEGIIYQRERAPEGPHGESTGFYGENSEAFIVHITAITHRRDPLSYGLICLRVEDYPRQLLRSGSVQARVIAKTGLTNIKEVYFPEVGRHGMLIVSATIRDKEDPKRIMDGIWNDLGDPWRWLIVVDEDCNVRDWDEVMWRVAAVVEPEKHVVLGKVHEIVDARKTIDVDFDPPSRGMGIDATFGYKGLKLPRVNKPSRDIMDRVVKRWKELGLA